MSDEVTAATMDQPLSNGNGVDIANCLCKDIQDRATLGEERYGERLQPFNGRSALVDAYQESLDLPMYLRQLIEEARDEQGHFIRAFNDLQQIAHKNAVEKGFWTGDQGSPGNKIGLMHSELSEALESERMGNPESTKIPGFSNTEEEFADEIIRIMDYGGKHALNIAGAIFAKMAYNATRPYRHGKNF